MADEDDAALAAALAGARVLLAYGLLGEVFARLGRLGVDYMGGQLAWLRGALGAESAAVLRLPTAAPVALNAARLHAALLGDDRPAVIIAHSKGGLEALEALLRPGAAARCRAFITIQAPFHGSPVADALCGMRGVHLAAGGMLRAFRLGTGEGLRDLTVPVRHAWMAAHAAEVAALVAGLPVVCCGSAVGPEAAGPDRRYLPLAHWMERHGAGPNDGLVPVASTLLPGARGVVFSGSHRALVAAGPGRDPIGVLRRLLRMALLGCG